MAEAAAIGVPYITAWTALMRAGALQPGETVLITGATGAVGRAAIQIVRWQGGRSIGVGRSDKATEADLYINAETQDASAAVVAAAQGRGADLGLDSVGGAQFETALRGLRAGGRQIAIASAGTRRVEFDLIDFYHRQQQLIGLDTMALTGSEIAAILDILRPGFEADALTRPPHAIAPIDKAIDVYTAMSAGRCSLKHVIGFD